MTVAMAVVLVFSNKCAWFGIKARAKQGVAVSDNTLLRRFKKLSRSTSSRNIYLRSIPLIII
jgi:hypothetical protein